MELVPTKRLQLFAGRGNRELSDEIAAALDVPLGEVVLTEPAGPARESHDGADAPDAG